MLPFVKILWPFVAYRAVVHLLHQCRTWNVRPTSNTWNSKTSSSHSDHSVPTLSKSTSTHCVRYCASSRGHAVVIPLIQSIRRNYARHARVCTRQHVSTLAGRVVTTGRQCNCTCTHSVTSETRGPIRRSPRLVSLWCWNCYDAISSAVLDPRHRLRNDLCCVEWGVKLYSNKPRSEGWLTDALSPLLMLVHLPRGRYYCVIYDLRFTKNAIYYTFILSFAVVVRGY